MESSPSLENLIHLEHWQKLQDIFSSITGLSLRTLDCNGNLLARPSGEPKLCLELLKNPQSLNESCDKCLPTFLGGKEIIDLNLSFSCHVGLHNFLVPLKLDSKVLGYVVMGPLILVARKPREEYINTAERLSMELNHFWNLLLEIRVISFQRAQSIIEMIRVFSEYILKTAYTRITFEEQLSEIKDAQSSQVNSMLKVFLEVALQVSGADIGSIMLLKKDADELTIRVAKGIPDEIIKNVKVKLGEGISGTVARDDTPVLIDNDLKDNRIQKYLNRPYIQSSMVVPIKIENNVLGVMNLGALDISPVRFTTENLGRMSELINITTLAFRAPVR